MRFVLFFQYTELASWCKIPVRPVGGAGVVDSALSGVIEHICKEDIGT